MLAIAITESGCNYKVKHPDKDTCGIGGIKAMFWPEIENVNSLMAIEEIVEILKTKAKGNIYLTIKYYKGGITNMKSTDKCYRIYKELRNVL